MFKEKKESIKINITATEVNINKIKGSIKEIEKEIKSIEKILISITDLKHCTTKGIIVTELNNGILNCKCGIEDSNKEIDVQKEFLKRLEKALKEVEKAEKNFLGIDDIINPKISELPEDKE